MVEFLQIKKTFYEKYMIASNTLSKKPICQRGKKYI